MISELSQRFGDRITFENFDYYTFPEPDALANATVDELRECKLGFRAKRIQKTARIIHHSRISFEELKEIDYKAAKEELLQLPGVGNKVADCVLLFSLEKLEAFPIDIWIKRVIKKHYISHLDALLARKVLERTSLSSKEYNKIGSFARDYFGKYAGYAQEYLFHFIRDRAP